MGYYRRRDGPLLNGRAVYERGGMGKNKGYIYYDQRRGEWVSSFL
jgi:hypothetical protein